MKEECGLSTSNLQKMGVLYAEFEDKPNLIEVHVFQTYEFSGELTESEEMRPKWFDLEEIPFDKMWPDNRNWLPNMLKGQFFTASLLYRSEDVVIKQDIKFEKPFENLS